MSFVDIFKTLFYLERVDQSVKLREYTGFYCTDDNLVSERGNYAPIPIEDISYRPIKIRWPNLCKVYNIPYTIICGCENYLPEVLSDKKTKMISEWEPSQYGTYLVTIRHGETIYRIATYRGKITIISSLEVPLAPSLTARNVETVRLQYNNHGLSIKPKYLNNSGMLVYYDTGAYKDIATLLSGDLCVVTQDKSKANVTEVLSDTSKIPHHYFEYDCIHAILEDKNDIDDRYKKLVTALRCLDSNLPGKLQAILDSMEE